MIKKENRLKKNKHFNYIYKNGNHISSSALVLYFLPSKTKSIKVGFAVTKKVGHAVVRNKIRRRLREIVRIHLPNLKQSYNIIVVARENILNFSFEELNHQYANLIKKADILNIDEKIS